MTRPRTTVKRPVLALSDDVENAKLVLGLARLLPPGGLTVVADTGVDFEHLGLRVAAHIDRLAYVLASLDIPQAGPGRHNEARSFMSAPAELGSEAWFKFGDGDLALPVERTRRPWRAGGRFC